VIRRLIDIAVILLIAVIAYGWWRNREAPAPRSAAAAPFDWSSVSSRDLDIASVFLTARQRGVRQAMDSLRSLAAKDTSLQGAGHMIAHALGRFAIADNGHDPAVLAQCTPAFESGCYHGVLEGYLMSLPRVDDAQVSAMCSSYDKPGATRVTAVECAHGLGHGYLEHYGYALEPSLHGCDTFMSTELRGECYDGVFMETAVHGLGMPGMNVGDSAVAMQMGSMARMEPDKAQMTRFRASDLQFPCDSVGTAYQPSCWSYQPLVIVNLTHADFAKTLAACGSAPPASQPSCYRGYGKQSTAWFGWDEHRVISTCSRAGAHVDDCLAGGVEALIDRDQSPAGALAFCGAVPAESRTKCVEAARARATDLAVGG
jgi:hypothetical protein